MHKTCIYASFEGGQNYEYSDINDVSDLYLQWIKNKKPRMPMNIISPILNGKREIKEEEYFLICNALGVPLDKFAKKDSSELEKDAG